jgi:hypothetical protein
MDFFLEYKTQILQVLSFVTLPFLVMLISLAFVYITGRMLNITKKATSKNAVALFIICASYAFYFICIIQNVTLYNKIWSGLTYGALSIIFYVTIGFKLFDRVDNVLDKVAPDVPREPKKKK